MSDFTVTLDDTPNFVVTSNPPPQIDIVVEDAPAVELQAYQRGPKGDPGDPGAIGPPGPPGATFEFVQTQPASQWTIPHMLGYNPNVTIIDSTHQQILASVSYPDENTVVINFGSPETGMVTCS